MDIEYFLKERTSFALYFYENASKPFNDIMHLIEKEKEPYTPPYSEDGEPAFLQEWLHARDGLDSIGLAAISMLSSSIQLFLSCWADRIDNSNQKLNRKGNKGWLNAYKNITKDYGVDYSNCPANFDLIEQTVLARNRTQHAESIICKIVSHSDSDLEKFPSPHFVSQHDQQRLSSMQQPSWWVMPNIHVDQQKLNDVVDEIEKYCHWLEEEYTRILAEKNA